jgi:predicted component of type VI protein secretion system
MVVRFHVVSPAAKQRTFTVRLPILLGRGEEAKFRIQHDLISRRHCEFFEQRGHVYVRDLGSTNGTFMNDEQVPASTKTAVPPGATVRVGALSFMVDYEAPTDHPTATVAPQAGVDPITVGESRVATGAHPLDGREEPPDFTIEHAEQPDDAAAGRVVAAEPVTGFAFLADADSAAPPQPAADWPAADAAAAADAPDDDQLDAFFKGLK